MLDNCMVDFKVMLQRMQNIEEYEKTRLLEKQNATISKFTLIFTVLFGLPLIHETLTTIKNIFQVQKDIIPILTTGHASWMIWMSLILGMIKDIIKQHLEYEGIRINIIKMFRMRKKTRKK